MPFLCLCGLYLVDTAYSAFEYLTPSPTLELAMHNAAAFCFFVYCILTSTECSPCPQPTMERTQASLIASAASSKPKGRTSSTSVMATLAYSLKPTTETTDELRAHYCAFRGMQSRSSMTPRKHGCPALLHGPFQQFGLRSRPPARWKMHDRISLTVTAYRAGSQAPIALGNL